MRIRDTERAPSHIYCRPRPYTLASIARIFAVGTRAMLISYTEQCDINLWHFVLRGHGLKARLAYLKYTNLCSIFGFSIPPLLIELTSESETLRNIYKKKVHTIFTMGTTPVFKRATVTTRVPTYLLRCFITTITTFIITYYISGP